MPLDVTRWAVVGYKDNTGLGRMAEDVKVRLGVTHLVVPSERLSGKALAPSERLLARELSETELKRTLSGLHGLLVLESHAWHADLFRVAKALHLKVVVVPMWEWFRGTDEIWKLADLFICPTQYCLDVVRRYGFNNSVYLPWLLNLRLFPARHVHGPARLFIHNAGLVDHDDRKGTRDTILAFRRVQRRDLRLVVRLQKPAPLPELDERIEVRVGDLADPAALYAEGDVAIQPSKMEGVGFMVLEPWCCGLPVITTDYPPMKEYVNQVELRVKTRWFKREAFPTRAARVKHAHLKLPNLRDLTRKIEWCATQDMGPISEANRRQAETLFTPEALQARWLQTLSALG